MDNNITLPTEEKTKNIIPGENTSSKKVPFAVVEAYKTIRTNIMFSLPQSGCKAITVSSAIPGEGKSTTAVNIAIAFSQLGKKVLLIDADLRRPSIHKKMKLLNTKGLYTALVGLSPLSECIQSVNRYFDVLTSGPLPPNPTELLGGEVLSTMLNSLEEKYDYIIFDSTPINIVSDALTLAPKTDGLLLVVRDGNTNREEIRYAIEACKMGNIRILGAVLNAISSKNSGKYTYRKRYSYQYRYRYNYNYDSNKR